MTALLVLLLLQPASAPGPIDTVYRYRATLHRVIDGDTYELTLDLGFHVSVTLPFRLYGWDCPELPTPAGTAATEKARHLFASAKTVILESYRGQQSFARWIARIWIDGRDLGELLAPACVRTR
jgi:micrococcal nuclease